jgi:hypothetical protein
MTDWNPKNMSTLDAWSANLSLRLAETLPPETAVELLAMPDGKRYAIIHREHDEVRVELKFPESLDVVMARISEEIK